MADTKLVAEPTAAHERGYPDADGISTMSAPCCFVIHYTLVGAGS